ncbi:hydroxysteroid dehydrogenase-like protein 2 [Oryzias latipes]|uniref:Hydroxysteroid dehydrogenase-like protein 2 n=1 Tax=Oryzias latipes TaxID=8090 RepID=A0A3B3HXM2_ORYLA|nr:hydroxysteroid dehydrogenase-like protein 2 [Oryzias latipes]
MLQNTGKLAGCTLFITGASRGIGKAIALKAARDGANVVIAAKTAEQHPKLPGTIYTAAEEVEAAGGKALPCIVDIRDEQQIGTAVQKAIDTFGGIDILVNNASAISLTGTLETPMKKVDLMLGINLRGTYLTSKLIIPHLLKSRCPHILNLSPPLNLNPVWFKNHTAYTMAKYGMSMCVLGMAEEFRGQLAVNALWPKTAIQTAAMDMLGGEGVAKQCRKADIMADAAYAILSKPKEYTGHFLVDEDVLREQGVQDFEAYAVQPGHPLLPDFFLDETPDVLVQQMEQHGATPAFKPPPLSTAPPPSDGPIESTFNAIRGVLSEDVVKSTQGVYRFDLSGEHAGVWFLDLKSGSGSAGKGDPSLKADVVMKMDSGDFNKMFAGKLKPTLAFMSGKLQIKGDMTLAIKLEKLMSRMNKAKL